MKQRNKFKILERDLGYQENKAEYLGLQIALIINDFI